MFLVFGVWVFYKTDLIVFNCDIEGAMAKKTVVRRREEARRKSFPTE